MNRREREKPKKTAKQRDGAPAKRKKAVKKLKPRTKRPPEPEPSITPEERHAKVPVNWFEVFHKQQRERDAAAILKQEKMYMYQVRYIIGTIFQRISDHAPFICDALLGELIREGIIQRGPQWDPSLAPSMMGKSLRQRIGLNRPIKEVIDDCIVEGYGPFQPPRG